MIGFIVSMRSNKIKTTRHFGRSAYFAASILLFIGFFLLVAFSKYAVTDAQLAFERQAEFYRELGFVSE